MPDWDEVERAVRVLLEAEVARLKRELKAAVEVGAAVMSDTILWPREIDARIRQQLLEKGIGNWATKRNMIRRAIREMTKPEKKVKG